MFSLTKAYRGKVGMKFLRARIFLAEIFRCKNGVGGNGWTGLGLKISLTIKQI
jgi:hypothetical protein